MTISEVTKRDIFDELKRYNIVWYGRLGEVKFLNRFVDLKKLPSSDSRFKNMEEDISQHRINNYDWEDWWIVDDDRLNLLKDDKSFLEFLCQMIHPIARSDLKDVEELLNIFNAYLAPDGWKLVQKEKISGRPTFTAISQKTEIEFKDDNKISQKFTREQLKKCKEKLDAKDYDGAISSARSFLDGVIHDIYKRITGEKLHQKGNLYDNYKRIKGLLKLAPERSADNALKSILQGLVSIINGIDQISNKMGDRHVPKIDPQVYHAMFCVHTSTLVADFLYDRLSYLYRSKETLFNGLISALNSDKRLFPKEKLLADNTLKNILEKCDKYTRNLLKEKFIQDYEIYSYKENDIFFAVMRIFWDDLIEKDIQSIYKKCKDNNQTHSPYGGLQPFLIEIKNGNSGLIDDEVSTYLSKHVSKI